MDLSGKAKIAYFLDTSKGLGGAGNLLLQQASLMADLYDVIVVIPIGEEGSCNDEYVRRCKLNQLPYICIKYDTAYNFYLIDFIEAMNSAVEIEVFAREKKITFFHSVQLNIAAEYVARKLGIPHLMNIYSMNEEEFKICPGDIYPHYHLCDSRLYSERWSRELGIKSRCIRPVAIQNEIKKKNGYSGKSITLLMLGNVCEYKNQMTAIKAVEQCICKDEIKLHIAGCDNTDYAEECRLYVREHNLEQYIIFHGFASDIVPLLEGSDCLLCASYYESFPMSIVEAMTYDLTIISTPVAGIPEVLTDKENAFVSRDFSEKSIYASILECLEYYRNGKISAIHRNASQTWRKNFERNYVRNQMDLYYREIFSDKVYKNIQPFLDMGEDVRETVDLLNDLDKDGEDWIDRKFLYYTFIRKKLQGRKIYIWGAGKLGRLSFEIFKRICPNVEVTAFIDTFKEGFYCGVPVMKLESISLEEQSFYCVSFSKENYSAVQYLKNRGLLLNKQVWIMP